MTPSGKPPQPASGEDGDARLDPLEELARIMSDSTPNTSIGRQGQTDASSAPDPSDDSLDLGLGQGGLEEYFRDPDGAGDPQLSGTFGAASFEDNALADPLSDPLSDPLAGGDPASGDDILAGLDFNNLDLPGLGEPVAAPQDEPPVVESQPAPMLSQHLTPRSPVSSSQPVPPPLASSQDAPIQEDDLLAAMDQLALGDEPAVSSATAAPPPDFLAEPAQPAPPFNAEAEPSFTPFSGRGASVADPIDEVGEPFGADAADDLDEPDSQSRGTAKTIALALGVLAVVGLSGVVAYGLFVNDGADSGSPQLIAAPEGDNKEEPLVTTNDERIPGEAVFSALDEGGQGTDTSPRVVLPGPGAAPLDLSGNTAPPRADIAPAAPGSTAARPVRTVTVRADGTVVESTSVPETAAAPTVSEVTTQQTAPLPQPVAVQTVTTPVGSATVTTQPSDARLPTQEIGTPAPALQAPVVTQAPTAPPQPTARPATAPQPVVSQPTANQPVQLTAPAAAPAAPAATAPVPSQPTPAPTQIAAAPALPSSVTPGDFVVQLASLRSDEQARATFSTLQTRFGSILSGFSPNIQQVDLGDRGIYHRVRLGPMDRADADSLCQRYQAAGGDCFVQRQ